MAPKTKTISVKVAADSFELDIPEEGQKVILSIEVSRNRSGGVSLRFASRVVQPASGPMSQIVARGPLKSLTKRQLEVLSWIISGHTCGEVGEILGVSHRTVESHSREISRRLGVSTRADLFRIAVTNGLKPRLS